MKSIETLKAMCPNAKVESTKYRNQFIVNGRWVGTYQNWEVTPGDPAGSRKNRKSLRDSEIAAYVNEGTLPGGFESRAVISGGLGNDEAKAQLKAAPEAQQTETINLEKPAIEATSAKAEAVLALVRLGFTKEQIALALGV